MTRIPLLLRALMLVPLFAVGVDHARVSVFCSDRAQSCLEAAGGGMLGPAGLLVLALYAAGLGLVVARFARRGTTGGPPGLARTWLAASLALAGVCGGHALLATALGDGSALGGGWLEILPLCAAAGGLLALALRVVPAAARLLLRIRPRALRLRAPVVVQLRRAAVVRRASSRVLALTAAGRAPPLTLG